MQKRTKGDVGEHGLAVSGSKSSHVGEMVEKRRGRRSGVRTRGDARRGGSAGHVGTEQAQAQAKSTQALESGNNTHTRGRGLISRQGRSGKGGEGR